MGSDDYYYEFKYVNGLSISTVKFPADIQLEDLMLMIRQFLLASSWSEEQLDDIFSLEEEE